MEGEGDALRVMVEGQVPVREGTGKWRGEGRGEGRVDTQREEGEQTRKCIIMHFL